MRSKKSHHDIILERGEEMAKVQMAEQEEITDFAWMIKNNTRNILDEAGAEISK